MAQRATAIANESRGPPRSAGAARRSNSPWSIASDTSPDITATELCRLH